MYIKVIRANIFTSLAALTSKTFSTDVPITLETYTKSLCIVIMSQCGTPCQKWR